MIQRACTQSKETGIFAQRRESKFASTSGVGRESATSITRTSAAVPRDEFTMLMEKYARVAESMQHRAESQIVLAIPPNVELSDNPAADIKNEELRTSIESTCYGWLKQVISMEWAGYFGSRPCGST